MINICGLMKGLDCSERDGDLCRSSRSCKWKNQTNAYKKEVKGLNPCTEDIDRPKAHRMEKELICPKCGCDDIPGIIYDTDENDRTLVQKLYGHCSHCGALVYWKMKYSFIGYESIEAKENH